MLALLLAGAISGCTNLHDPNTGRDDAGSGAAAMTAVNAIDSSGGGAGSSGSTVAGNGGSGAGASRMEAAPSNAGASAGNAGESGSSQVGASASGGTSGEQNGSGGSQAGTGGSPGSGGSPGIGGSQTGAGGSQAGAGGSQAGAGGSPGSGGSPGTGGSTSPPLGPWMQLAYIKASNPDAGDVFANRVAISADGTTLAFSAINEKSKATGVDGDQTDNSLFRAGAVYVFSNASGAWKQEAYVKASNTSDDAQFANTLALSGDGNTLVVGAPNESGTSTGVNSAQTLDSTYKGAGAAYVFTRSSGKWTQHAYVKASNTGPSDSFGFSVSLSGDGRVLAVGAIDDDSDSAGVDGDDKNENAKSSGAVYLFRRSGATWYQANYIKASNAGASDAFGFAVSLAADANTLAVTAPGEASKATGVDGDQSDNSAMTAGAVYVFARNGASWTQEGYVKASNAEGGDAFGWSVSLASDGSSLAVGSFLEASNATGIDGDQANNSAMGAGAAYFYLRNAGKWRQTAYLKGANTGAGDGFGVCVSLSGDAQVLAVGAGGEDSAAKGIGGDATSNAVMQSGAAYVFTRDGDSWKQDAYIKASNTAASDAFGIGVSLPDNGRLLLVGANSESSNARGVNGDQTDRSDSQAGAGYLFTR